MLVRLILVYDKVHRKKMSKDKPVFLKGNGLFWTRSQMLAALVSK